MVGSNAGKTGTTSHTRHREISDDWKQILEPLLNQYDPNDIFNADETGLFWRLLPDKTHAVKGETCSGGKKSKERITLLVCANIERG